MGEDLHPQYHLLHSAWGSSSYNCMRNLQPPPVILQQNINSMGFPANSNPYEFALPGNAAVAFPRFQLPIYGLAAPSMPINGVHEIAKRFMVLDNSGDQRNLIFSYPTVDLMNQGPLSSIIDIQGSNGTDVTNGNDNDNEEMHEDTDEIDALLYSDSEDYAEDEEDASTGHSPVEITAARSNEEVASSSLPAKKRRLNSDIDESLVDTASSARACYGKDDDAESSCGGGKNREIGKELEEEEEIISDAHHGNKRMKRERIHETVGLLRGIIPGVKGKDAATILDEAITYLKSLRHKAKALGATNAV